MRAPGSRFCIKRAVEVLSCLGRFVFPHEGLAQGEQGAQMLWGKDQDSFPIALGAHPIVHLRGTDSKKEVGVRVIRSRPINRIQVAARLSRLIGSQCFPCFSPFFLQLWRQNPGAPPWRGLKSPPAPEHWRKTK